MTFTVMGKQLPAQLLRRHYRVILSKIEDKELSVRARTVLQTVMKARHVFRGGTVVDTAKIQERKTYYTGTTHSPIKFIRSRAHTHTTHHRPHRRV